MWRQHFRLRCFFAGSFLLHAALAHAGPLAMPSGHASGTVGPVTVAQATTTQPAADDAQKGAPASAPAGTQAPGATDTTTPVVEGEATLPRDLSPWGMFMAADVVVKAVMIGLAFASVVTWTVWLAKSIELLTARRLVQRSLRHLSRATSLAEAASWFRTQQGDVAKLVRAATAEVNLSLDAPDKQGIKERVQSRLERIEAGAGRRMARGTGLLATIGSTGPFVGLFGTVWGIMNSFIGISKAHTTNLAVVAPGIAEALLATALGLVAAIPAVVIFNFFARWITGYRALLADASAEILRLVSRDLDRGAWDYAAGEEEVALAPAAE